MARVELESIGKSFGDTAVLSGINLDVEDGEFLTLVGPSGCGKSTLIRIIAGLEPQTSGRIRIDGAPVDDLRPHERRVAMVFQSYALYPHLSVFANMALPLTMQRLSLWERLPLLRLLSARRRRVMPGIAQEVRSVAAQLQIEPLLLRRPAQLSGGQRQRVALGRAMVRHPGVFLMDEPLSNLDAKLRVHMRSELTELHQRLKSTFVYVTHDQVEAMTMSDRVAMMDAGRILQLGTPAELYARPANVTVAQFIGSPAINLLPARIEDGGIAVLADGSPILRTLLPPGSTATIGLRPETLRLLPPGDPTRPAPFQARLRRVENLGAECMLHVDLPTLPGQGLVIRAASAGDLTPGTMVGVAYDPAAAHVFDASGNRVAAVATAAPAARLAQAEGRVS
ncbi:ABC transporter ATP-binding protein [Roseomonas nepalensis]|uniref:ABC transporter ATP-binding protein n=1 Tax=Muricoccus nepalensis TaxID=1854500 RepID=A0A502G842_9PROT|nr:ABC transporter ATP-binding protein [Roseomonas nepalensis]TPG57801.1 ABC transporter ATP-binding protein [Roseomonas nepalensis]